MISRIVPMGFSFLKYVRRSESLWTLLYPRLQRLKGAQKETWRRCFRHYNGVGVPLCAVQVRKTRPSLFAIGETGKAR
jgi:hypothetical protein